MFKDLSKLKQILTRKEQLQFVILLCAITMMAFTQALGVASVMPFISLIMEPSVVFENRWLLFAYESMKFRNIQSFTVFSGLVMLAIIIIANSISALTIWIKIKLSLINNYRLSKRLLQNYLAMPYAFFLNQNSSELSKNVLSEVDYLTHSYILPILQIVTRGLLVLFILILLFWVDVMVSLVVLFLIGGIYAIIYWRIKYNLKQFGSARMEADETRYRTAYEAFGGIKETKVMNREKFFLDRYSFASLQHARYNSWCAVVGQLPRFALEVIAFGGIIVYSLILLLTQDDVRQVIPLAGLFAFAGYRLMPAIQDIFNSMTTVRYSQPVLERIHRDVATGIQFDRIDDISSENVTEPLVFKKTIIMKNVSYYYPNSRNPIIRDINLSIEYNSNIAFVGPTGAGKTTLVDIILGLLIPQKGELFVDGQLINEKNLKKWQMNLGYVPQEIYLCDDTVAHNIAFGIPTEEINMASLEYAARLANVEEFIKYQLPNGFNTIIGERGIRISGGERQRIGIARALYHDPSVIIFDEATSALDGITEEVILESMENIAKHKNLIIIAHRLTTVKKCDVIYIIEKGMITGQGTYDDLLSSNRKFQAMAKIR